MASYRVALICNPRAGSLAALPDAPARLVAGLAAAGFEVALPPAPDLPLDKQWRRATRAGPEVVFVAGGDGTLRAAAVWALREGVTLAFLPGGTMNRVCARLGLPRDLEASVAAYAGAVPDRMTIGFAGEEPFLYQAMFGAVARLLRYRERQRRVGMRGWATLAAAIWRRLRGLAERRLRVTTPDGRPRRGRVAVITVPAQEDGTRLQVAIAAPRGMRARARMAWRWFRGRLGEDREVTAISAASLAVRSGRRVRYSLDGEMRLGRSPVEVRAAPRALRILRPVA